MSGEPVSKTLAGFYGKLPSRGDFVSRNLPSSFIEVWDQWLQQAMTESRNRLGDNWLDAYLNSPVWRFGLSCGICGQQAWSGVMIPSVDRVGRYFPLTLVVSPAHDQDLLGLLARNNDWYQQAEDLVLTGLDDNFDLDEFSENIVALGVPRLNDKTASPTAADNKLWHCPLEEWHELEMISESLGNRLLATNFSNPSLWWTQGSEHIAPCLLICPQLPPPVNFSALLVGDWQESGWCEMPFAGTAPPATLPFEE